MLKVYSPSRKTRHFFDPLESRRSRGPDSNLSGGAVQRDPPAHTRICSSTVPRRLYVQRLATTESFRSFVDARALSSALPSRDKSRWSGTNTEGAETRRYGERCMSQRRATRTHVRSGDAHRVCVLPRGRCVCVRIYVYAMFTAIDNVKTRATIRSRAATRADTHSRSRRDSSVSRRSSSRDSRLIGGVDSGGIR